MSETEKTAAVPTRVVMREYFRDYVPGQTLVGADLATFLKLAPPPMCYHNVPDAPPTVAEQPKDEAPKADEAHEAGPDNKAE